MKSRLFPQVLWGSPCRSPERGEGLSVYKPQDHTGNSASWNHSCSLTSTSLWSPPLLGGVSIWLTGELCASVCILFSRSVLLPVGRNKVFPSLCLRTWSMLPAVQQQRVPVLSPRRPGAGHFHRRPLSMAGCLWMSLPLSSGPFLGSSVLTGLEPSPNLSPIHAQRDPPSAWDPSTMNLGEAQMRRRKGNSQSEHIQGPIVEPHPSLPFSLMLAERRGGVGSGEGLENGREVGGTWSCSDTLFLLLPTPSPNCPVGSHSSPQSHRTGIFHAASPTPSTTASLCSWPFKCSGRR